jgi:hypothetical protein
MLRYVPVGTALKFKIALNQYIRVLSGLLIHKYRDRQKFSNIGQIFFDIPYIGVRILIYSIYSVSLMSFEEWIVCGW